MDPTDAQCAVLEPTFRPRRRKGACDRGPISGSFFFGVLGRRSRARIRSIGSAGIGMWSNIDQATEGNVKVVGVLAWLEGL